MPARPNISGSRLPPATGVPPKCLSIVYHLGHIVHLGHIITFNLDDKLDIMRVMKDMNHKANSLLCTSSYLLNVLLLFVIVWWFNLACFNIFCKNHLNCPKQDFSPATGLKQVFLLTLSLSLMTCVGGNKQTLHSEDNFELRLYKMLT